MCPPAVVSAGTLVARRHIISTELSSAECRGRQSPEPRAQSHETCARTCCGDADDGVRHQSRDGQARAVVHERRAGNLGGARARRAGAAGDGAVRKRRAAALRAASSACGSRAARSGRTCRGASRSSIRRRSTPSRCRAGSSTSRAASCRISTTKRSSSGCSGTKSGTSPRATRRSSTRAAWARRSACWSAASSCRRCVRSATSRRAASACCSSSSGATTSCRPTRWARDTRRAADGIPTKCRQFLTTLARIAETTDRNGVPNWLSTHPQPENRAERVGETVKKVRTAGMPAAVDGRSRRLSRAHRRHRLWRQSRRRHRARQRVPASAAAVCDRVSRRLGDHEQRRAGRRAGAGEQGVHGAAHHRRAAGARRSIRQRSSTCASPDTSRPTDVRHDQRDAGGPRHLRGERVGHRPGDGARRARPTRPPDVFHRRHCAAGHLSRASPAISTAPFSRSAR